MKDEYSTKDLYFASFLHFMGISVKKIEQYGYNKRDRNPCYFIFEDRNKCEELENAFWNGTGELANNIKNYVNAIRDLRTRMSSIKRLIRQKEMSLENSHLKNS